MSVSCERRGAGTVKNHCRLGADDSSRAMERDPCGMAGAYDVAMAAASVRCSASVSSWWKRARAVPERGERACGAARVARSPHLPRIDADGERCGDRQCMAASKRRGAVPTLIFPGFIRAGFGTWTSAFRRIGCHDVVGPDPSVVLDEFAASIRPETLRGQRKFRVVTWEGTGNRERGEEILTLTHGENSGRVRGWSRTLRVI